ncbi:MAG: glycosyltransferase family 2 protein [Candidatus Sumerlaeia bacterium]|nr:glycosyltransferase family 2 protein [Candidatus Sumerlaeia bacterium]
MTSGKASREKPAISLVIPMKNEESNVERVCREAAEVFERDFSIPWEIIVVSDESTDETDDILATLHAEEPRIRGLRLTPGQGQSAALEAGFRLARAPIIATMDGDGQNDPADLPALHAAMLEKGVDMMCGIRAKRADAGVRRISSKIANKVRSTMLGDKISDVGCSIRVFRRRAALRIPLFRNFHRFFPALFLMYGYSVGEIPVNHRPRLAGESKYGGGIRKRLPVVIVDLFGVMWLRRRSFRYRIRKIEDE